MLADRLRSVRTPADLAGVFQELGYTASVEAADLGATRVAQWRGFEVLVRTSESPSDDARQFAAQLATRARRAVAASLGPGELALAAPRLGQGGSTRVLRVPLDAPDRLSLSQLQRLAPGSSRNALAHALRVREVLSAEAVGERFYRSFRELLDRMIRLLGSSGGPVDRRIVALLALTRVLFLYFVQAKGWLNGEPDFLRRLLDRTLGRGRHFHRSALHPLFFGTLNRPPSARRATTRLGRIPYLNGGLFQPHPAEQRVGSVVLPNSFWREAFDGLFERFRFCVRESHEVDAIAPDMLGVVFERVMDPGDRHATGTFYTPESVVRRVVDATLETVLASVVGPDQARRLFGGGTLEGELAARALVRLRGLRLLDPAVGSGAFLLGALDRLTELRIRLGESGPAGPIRRLVLQNSLFGVDLSPIAVRLAELRLWLAIVADDPVTDIGCVQPLPNLDGMVRQGDALFDPLGAARAVRSGGLTWATGINAAHAARKALFDARGTEHTAACRNLHALERQLAQRLIESQAAAVSFRLREIDAEAQSPDLFGRRPVPTPAARMERAHLEATGEQLQRARAALHDGQLPFFSFEVHVPEVIAGGGFDAVIGNPPWVRAERISPVVRSRLQHRFSWWTAGGSSGFHHQPDLAVAFLQRSLELTAPGGAIGLLLPSKVATAGYAETARRSLVRETRLAYVHRVPQGEAARFRAAIYPLALVAEKRPALPTDTVHLELGKGAAAVAQQWLDRPGPWILLPDRERDALEQFRAAGRPLREVALPSLGVKTGADRLFVGELLDHHGPVASIRLNGERVLIERDLVRPALRGRDLRPFRARPRTVLVWTHDGDGGPRARLPAQARQYFQSHRAVLERRADQAGEYFWSVFRTAPSASRHRIAWPDISRRPAAVALELDPTRHAIPLNTCYVAPAPDEDTAFALSAVFNSTWAAALFQATGDEARGAYRRINARVAGELPIPPVTALPALASLARTAHLAGRAEQEELDDAVARALGLTARVCSALRGVAGVD